MWIDVQTFSFKTFKFRQKSTCPSPTPPPSPPQKKKWVHICHWYTSHGAKVRIGKKLKSYNCLIPIHQAFKNSQVKAYNKIRTHYLTAIWPITWPQCHQISDWFQFYWSSSIILHGTAEWDLHLPDFLPKHTQVRRTYQRTDHHPCQCSQCYSNHFCFVYTIISGLAFWIQEWWPTIKAFYSLFIYIFLI